MTSASRTPPAPGDEARRRLQELEAVFLSDATLQTYGEGVSVRAHMLQAAELASLQGLSEALVAAALLHDLGWVLPGEQHDLSAAVRLEPVLGPAVAGPVRLHVAAKRYLVAQEPEYFQLLSPASRDTLVLQGGPMTKDERRSFEALPGFRDALALRRLDDAAKDPGRAGPPFSTYRPLLERLAGAHLRSSPSRTPHAPKAPPA